MGDEGEDIGSKVPQAMAVENVDVEAGREKGVDN
jgi:hypothetical protein